MDGFTFINDQLIAKLAAIPSSRNIKADLRKHGERMADGYKVKESIWSDLRRDYNLAPSRGFGDTFAKLTKKMGLPTCDKCRKRRRRLNALVKYK